jgi:hypothetical protein
MKSTKTEKLRPTVLEEVGSKLSPDIRSGFPAGKSRRTLIVDLLIDGLSLCIVDELGRVESDKCPITDMKGLRDDVQGFAQLVNELSRKVYREADSRACQFVQLRGFGERLFERIFPEQLRRNIRSCVAGTWLGVASNEDWIPWELLHDGTGFLGERFSLYRIPRPPTGRSTGDSRTSAAATTPSNQVVVVHVVGGGPDLDELAGKLNSPFMKLQDRIKFKPAVKFLVAQLLELIEERLKNEGGAHIIHFTCHGWRKPFFLQISSEDDASLNLTADALAVMPLRPASLVFANACGSAIAESTLGECLSFGWAVYAKGAFYIGTLGAVSVEVALQFADLFYEKLAVSGDLFEAFMHAKHGIKPKAANDPGAAAKDTVKTDDVAHLLYCIYANPVETPRFSFVAHG